MNKDRIDEIERKLSAYQHEMGLKYEIEWLIEMAREKFIIEEELSELADYVKEVDQENIEFKAELDSLKEKL
jgi:hypothetical protein